MFFLLNPNRSLGFAWILFFRRVDFVWLLMSNSELLRIKNRQKAPYKKQKTASSCKKLPLNGLMADLGLMSNSGLLRIKNLQAIQINSTFAH